jgi:hypothetical protein
MPSLVNSTLVVLAIKLSTEYPEQKKNTYIEIGEKFEPQL